MPGGGAVPIIDLMFRHALTATPAAAGATPRATVPFGGAER
ncbi:hypothetical protein [Planomonospora sp. ID67723]|nr:hypothetical protein [Planomonospora sp. ID67723]